MSSEMLSRGWVPRKHFSFFSLPLKNIFVSGELDAEAVTEESSATVSDGKKYRMKYGNALEIRSGI